MGRRHSSGPRRRRESLARDGTGAETLGWEHLARHKPARRPQLPERRHDKHALRVAIRIGPLRDMEGSLGPGPELDNCTGEFQCAPPRADRRRPGSLRQTPLIQATALTMETER